MINPSYDDYDGIKDYESFLDGQVVVYLHDGRYFYGILRSFDQFNNITLENSFCRIFHGNEYAEKKIGLCIIRGENVVLLGLNKVNLSGLIKRDYKYLEQKTMDGNETEKL